MTARSHVIDASKSAYLRAGIKWDPLERDDIDELHGVGSVEEARDRLKAIPRERFIANLLASLFRATGFLKSAAIRAEAVREQKLEEKRDLEKYIAQAKLRSYDLDLCCFCYGGDGKLVGFALPDFTEMHGKAEFHSAFAHSGDDATGTGDAFDEELLINLNAVDAAVHRMFLVVVSVNHGFDKIKGGFWSLISTQNEEELMSSVMKTTAQDRAHVMAKLTRDGKNWLVEEAAEYGPLDIDAKIPIQNRVDQMLTARYLTPASGG